ncbi:hypothetical protein SDC9_118345 [bioreactor metagenome]|uniref:Uncharacterized protein n=1 Tax=bioreactor metagenome TaxID=1076179 RepID=A0A645C0U1_9ZZZZ
MAGLDGRWPDDGGHRLGAVAWSQSLVFLLCFYEACGFDGESFGGAETAFMRRCPPWPCESTVCGRAPCLKAVAALWGGLGGRVVLRGPSALFLLFPYLFACRFPKKKPPGGGLFCDGQSCQFQRGAPSRRLTSRSMGRA